MSGGGAGNTGGSFGKPNTNLLGATVDLNFNSVFGTAPSIANTNPDPFAAYRPSDTGTMGNSSGSSLTGTGGFGGNGRAGTTNTMSGANFRGTGVSGGTAGGLNFNNTSTGLAGGGAGLAGNRAGNSGNFAGGLNNLNRGNQNRGMQAGNTGMGNRGVMGGNNVLGGGGNLLGTNNNFLGGSGMNTGGQQAPMGYVVTIDRGTAAVTPPVIGTMTVNTEVRQRLAATPALQGVQNFEVLTLGDVAVLKGSVPDENAKRLAAAMALLEPGIYRIDNQLVVAAPLPAPKVER